MMQKMAVLILALLFLAPRVVRAADDDKGPVQLKVQIVTEQATRPAILTPLYASLAGLQIYDGMATLNGARRATETHTAIVGGLAAKPAAFWAVKAGSTAFSIVLAEKLWREHKRGQAIVTMVVSNALTAAIAARNASALRSTRSSARSAPR